MKKLSIIFTVVLLLTACRRESPPVPETAAPAALTAVFQNVEETETGPIPEIRSKVKPGDEVVFTAKVMGSQTPFVEGRALMVVGDEGSMTSCDLMEDDGHCPSPWDVCCEDPKAIQAGSASVQVVNADGRVLSHGLRGVKGLKELSRVRVRGVVAAMSTEQALLVNATAIEVLP